MSTARMKRRAKKKVWQRYDIEPCREITFRDGTVLMTYTVELKPKPCCKKSTRRRPTWGWRQNWRWSVFGSHEVLAIYSRLREAGCDRLEPLSDTNPFSALLRQAREEPEPRESVFEEARRKIMPEINARLREDMDRQAFFGTPPDSP